MRTGGDVSLEEAEEEVGKSTLVGVAACVPLDYREKKGCSVGLLLLCAQLAAERIYRQSGHKLHLLKVLWLLVQAA